MSPYEEAVLERPGSVESANFRGEDEDAPQRRDRQLWQYLPRGHKKRRRRSGRKVHSERIKWRTSIHDRPAEVEDRIEFGRWESDSVLGVHGTGALHTTVERRSRFLHAAKLPGPTARATMDAQIGFYQALPAHAVASATADNSSEFAYHYQLADTLGIPTYFADPYSAWQRGTNEHFNGRIRKRGYPSRCTVCRGSGSGLSVPGPRQG